MYHKLNSYQLTGYKNTYTVLSIQIGYYNIISAIITYTHIMFIEIITYHQLPKKLSHVLP